MNSGRHRDEPAASAADDRDALARVAAGDLRALEELYDRYKALAYGVALRVTGDAGLAEDAVHDAFLGAWRNVAQFESGRASVKTWLLSIVHHRAVDGVRRRRPMAELPASDEASEHLSVPDVWPEVAGRLDGAEIRAALAKLPQAQREAIELAYFEGLTQHEIAARTAAPLGTVKGRLRLGLLALRRTMGAGEAGAKLDGGEESGWASR